VKHALLGSLCLDIALIPAHLVMIETEEKDWIDHVISDLGYFITPYDQPEGLPKN
jgi:hypothetical protein